ncbi:uncharacterized protein YcaQ [Stackebrandtia albiflava]|uniref:Uncharacterized protein YcaQ n=1 Tax=Stackebrandtia albiflava TaxID=406432 RepID=A0A562VCB9_9ACTN|nr:winged helix DNA-binding domain-containing protein [Stackebrandtia albiflava]TWJ15516.1 uncharacterized protein YcaQ [Stackebrandtia albiflava]
MQTTLSRRALNRALLDRQGLLRRTRTTPQRMTARLLGLQAQLGDPPYYQLWTRIEGFRQAELTSALRDRSVVRVVLMRGTIHLIGAEDCMPLRALIQPFLTRTLFNGSQNGRKIVGVDPGELAQAGRDLLADGPLHNDEIAERLAARFPGYEGNSLAYGLRCLIPLVQVPPRGVWGEGGGLRYAWAAQWLDRPEESEPPATELLLRYLAAFGPASVADFQRWSSLTRTRELFTRLGDRLTVYRDPDGRELFDVAGTALPDPDTPVPVTLVGPFDNLLLSHADKSRVMGKAEEKRAFGPNAVIRGTYLVDGRVAGAWRADRSRDLTRLWVEPFAELTSGGTDELVARLEELARFAAPESETRIEFH